MRYYGLLTTCFFFSSESRYLRRFEANTSITDHAFECPQFFSNTLLRRTILPFGINCIYAFWKALFKDKMSVDDATYWYTWQYNSISLRNPFGLIQLVSWRGLLKLCFRSQGNTFKYSSSRIIYSMCQCMFTLPLLFRDKFDLNLSSVAFYRMNNST